MSIDGSGDFTTTMIGVGKGKEAHDKREDLKKRASTREMDREVSRFNKRHS